MDQSKWALPRNRLVQSSKETQTLIRPRVKLHAVWLHGVSLNLYVVHPGVPADSSLVAECLLRSLEDAVCLFKKYQKPFPRELFVFVPRLNHPDSVSNLVTQCVSLDDSILFLVMPIIRWGRTKIIAKWNWCAPYFKSSCSEYVRCFTRELVTLMGPWATLTALLSQKMCKTLNSVTTCWLHQSFRYTVFGFVTLRSNVWSTISMREVRRLDVWSSGLDHVTWPYNCYEKTDIDSKHDKPCPATPHFLWCNPVSPRKVKSILERINIRQWIGKKAVINVQWLTSCRNWKEWCLNFASIWK